MKNSLYVIRVLDASFAKIWSQSAQWFRRSLLTYRHTYIQRTYQHYSIYLYIFIYIYIPKINDFWPEKRISARANIRLFRADIRALEGRYMLRGPIYGQSVANTHRKCYFSNLQLMNYVQGYISYPMVFHISARISAQRTHISARGTRADNISLNIVHKLQI